ncbi:MAG: RsmD family RNA methyltransferase [Phycisphaerae bacterium]
MPQDWKPAPLEFQVALISAILGSAGRTVKPRALSLYYSAMRVISGRYRRHRLETPRGMDTRPIIDRVKASVFDWLGSRLALPGRMPPINVCDLFCGAGSQGIEALSRGATYCAFVETDRRALACLRENLARIGLDASSAVVDRPAEMVTIRPPDGRGFGLVLLDPPYRLSEDVSDESTMGRVTARLGEAIPVEPDALVLWRHAEGCVLPDGLPGGWRTIERRAWGSTAVTMLRRDSLD